MSTFEDTDIPLDVAKTLEKIMAKTLTYLCMTGR